jgi:hypothetical protein
MILSGQIETAHATDILATARRFTTLKRAGANEHVGPCPHCGGKDRFGVNVRKRVWNCRGCAKGGDVIALVQHATGVTFTEAIAELTGETITTNRRSSPRAPDPPPADDAERNRRSALRIFDGAGPIAGSLAERYLAGRSIDIEQLFDVDDVLRCAPSCRFGNERLPCLVALVRNVLSNEPVAIQRTALDSNAEKIGRLSLGAKAVRSRSGPTKLSPLGCASAKGWRRSRARRP